MKIKTFLSALLLMVSSLASAQYLNVKLEDGTYRSFKTTPKMKVSFGDKAGAEIMDPVQVVKLYKGDKVVAEYWYHEFDRIVYEEIPPTTGTANAVINDVVTPVNWVQLWKGGPKFAEYNVGATSATEYGGYYAWGGSQDKVDDQNTGTVALFGDSDTATKLWGNKWRMPTQAELQALLTNCDVQWTDDYKGDNTNIKGAIFTGKQGTAFASNSVFLPAAGHSASGSFIGQGGHGYFWSSTPNGGNNAYILYFVAGRQDVSNFLRSYGCSVRAVLKE